MNKLEKGEEQKRLDEVREKGVPWKKWGPILSERQWGTVRENYSESGDAWNYFTHDHARSRAYRWGEDGLAGISDDRQIMCFALALWNGKDPILKERLFGLSNSEGNHGEDVKEYYFYLDSTPTHSYMKYLYKYPQAAYPYADLLETNRRCTRNDMEYELLDTGVFEGDRYFDVFVEYAKGDAEDILVRITAINRGSDGAELHLLPTLWFRNDWSSWIAQSNRSSEKPNLKQINVPSGTSTVEATHPLLGKHTLSFEGEVPLLFTENETNHERLFSGQKNESPYVKDGINDYGQGHEAAVNPEKTGARSPPTTGALSAPAGRQPCGCALPLKSLPGKAGKRQSLHPSSGRSLTRHWPCGCVKRTSLPFRDSAFGVPGRGERHAPGHCRHALEQAVLLLRR